MRSCATEDYYALYGIFSSTRYAFPGTEIPRHSRNLVALVPVDRYETEIRAYEEKMSAIDKLMDEHYARKVSLDTGKERNAADAAHKKTNDERDAYQIRPQIRSRLRGCGRLASQRAHSAQG
jgi:hypothetical protein